MTTVQGSSGETLTDPAPQETRRFVERGIERGVLVTLFGRCTVSYDGRTASEIGPGDRHVMLKPDGTALVHTDSGQRPITWQSPGGEHEVAVEDGAVVVRSERDGADERLVVRFGSVGHAACLAVTDRCERSVSGTEADMRRRIVENPSLVEPGFAPLATERRTPVGAVDVYGEDAEGRTVVVELKRRRAGPDAVGQLARYVDALQRDLHDEAIVRGVLVAPSITDPARELLAERGMEFVALEPDVE